MGPDQILKYDTVTILLKVCEDKAIKLLVDTVSNSQFEILVKLGKCLKTLQTMKSISTHFYLRIGCEVSVLKVIQF